MSTYEAQKKELEGQIVEVERLQSLTANQGVKDLLSDVVEKVHSQIMKLKPTKYKKTSEQFHVNWFETDKNTMEITLLYEHVDAEKIETDIQSTSLDIKLHDVGGTNYRYTIPKLYKEIKPSDSKIVVDSQSVRIKLAKISEEKWSGLHFKEEKTQVGQKRQRE